MSGLDKLDQPGAMVVPSRMVELVETTGGTP